MNKINIAHKSFLEVKQDKGSLSLLLEEKGPKSDASKLQKKVQEKLKTLNEYLAKFEKLDKEVSQGLSSEFLSAHKSNLISYIAVKLSGYNFDDLNTIVMEVNDLGIDVKIHDTQCYVSGKSVTKHETKLTEKAIKEFMEKASNIATSFGLPNFELSEVTVSSAFDDNNHRHHRPMAMASALSNTMGGAGAEEEIGAGVLSPKNQKLMINISGSVVLSKAV